MVIQVQERLAVSCLNQLLDLATASVNLEAPFLKQVRDHAAAKVQELAIPTKQDEDWRFTDLSPLLTVQFQTPKLTKLGEEHVASLVLAEAAESRLVFVNGTYAPEFSNTAKLPSGVFVGSLEQLPENLSKTLDQYLAKQPGSQEVFTALNTAGLTDAAIIWVEKNQVIEPPIHVLLISTVNQHSILSQPRVLCVAESGSSVTFVEHFAAVAFGCSDQVQATPGLTNAVAELWLEENAEVKHIRVQRDAGSAFHIGRTAVSQARNSRYTCHAVSLGAKLSRHTLDVYQTGEGTETILNGLTLTHQDQLADTHSAMFLNYPHGRYVQVHKLVVDDQSAGVFNGRVIVPQSAQFTDASQLSRNLLLSSKARVNTKPQLEITADDVKCSHGATVSQLEEDEIFYLQSRGLDEETSRRLLIDGFSAEILDQIPLNSLKKMLTRCVACRVESDEVIANQNHF
ncbi:MAG: Fe-S cluster assembly protein SufD [Microcoleaceae cyanobacterium]